MKETLKKLILDSQEREFGGLAETEYQKDRLPDLRAAQWQDFTSFQTDRSTG